MHVVRRAPSSLLLWAHFKLLRNLILAFAEFKNSFQKYPTIDRLKVLPKAAYPTVDYFVLPIRSMSHMPFILLKHTVQERAIDC